MITFTAAPLRFQDIVALAHPCFKTCLRFQDIVALADPFIKTLRNFNQFENFGNVFNAFIEELTEKIYSHLLHL